MMPKTAIAVALIVFASSSKAQTLRPAAPVNEKTAALVTLAHADARRAELEVFPTTYTEVDLATAIRSSANADIKKIGRQYSPTRGGSGQKSMFETLARPTLEMALDSAAVTSVAMATTVENLKAEATRIAAERSGDSPDAAARAAAAAPVPIGGMAWQQTLILGFANYLANRTKAELIQAGLDKAGTRLCARVFLAPPKDITELPTASQPTDSIQLANLTPSTCRVLSLENSFPAWATLRAAVAKDIQGLPEAIVHRYRPGNQDALAYVKIGLQVARLMEKGDDPVWLAAGLLDAFPCDAAAMCKPKEVQTLFHGLGVAIRLIGSDDLIVKRDTSLRRAAGELLTALRPIYALAPENTVALRIVEGALVDAGRAIEEIRKIEESLKEKPTDATLYARYVAAGWNLMGTAQRLMPGAVDADLQKKIVAADSILRPLLAAMDLIRGHDYAGAYVEAQVAVTQAFPSAQMPRFFTTYGPFLAQLATAKDEKAIEQTLATASPPGSYRAKRGAGNVSFALNAFVGGQAGMESTAADPGKSDATYGLYAPIGFEASWGVGGRPKSSLGLFLSIVDLGALMSLRGDSDEPLTVDPTKVVESGSEIGFKQVLAPGIYATWGLARSYPIAIGGGVSLHPDLRSVRDASNNRSKTSARRWAVFVAADMPVFRF